MGTIIAYIVIGLLGGAIAKAILPGRQGGGWVATMILGIIGADPADRDQSGAVLKAFVLGLLSHSREYERATHRKDHD